MTRTARVQVGVLAVVSSLLAACGAAARSVAPPPTVVGSTPGGAARTFLTDFVDADGRVVRRDQGGDTVSEGQAYALLLDVATGNRAQFATVWAWSVSHLRQADGLLAYHWSGGSVVDANPASDADLDIARALFLAATRWHEPALAAAGRTYAAAILADETLRSGGRLWLLAGPWARHGRHYLDPSYLDPETFAVLAGATGDRRWDEVASSSSVAVAEDTASGTRLPSDWAVVAADGTVTASAPPAGGPTVYGYDAFRTLVRQYDGCGAAPGRSLDARLVGLAARTVAEPADTYRTDGAPAEPGSDPLMSVAAAAAEEAAGAPGSAAADLQAAAVAAARAPTYFLDAWVALGRYLLTTTDLDVCTTPGGAQ